MGDQCGSDLLSVVVSSLRHVVTSISRWGTKVVLLCLQELSAVGGLSVASVGRWGTSVVLLCLQELSAVGGLSVPSVGRWGTSVVLL